MYPGTGRPSESKGLSGHFCRQAQKVSEEGWSRESGADSLRGQKALRDDGVSIPYCSYAAVPLCRPLPEALWFNLLKI